MGAPAPGGAEEETDGLAEHTVREADPDPITAALTSLCTRVAVDRSGSVARYIPELADSDPEKFGTALVSLGGHLYQAGDADVCFTLQSVSKPFAFALALADRGLEGVLERVGSEPSGEGFNAISLDPVTGRPANPMINAGAIVTSSLVDGRTAADRFDRIHATLSAFAGRPLEVDERVFASERATGDRNRALAYLMRNAGSLDGDVDDAIDVYFRQCALLVTSGDLAVMAGTLANGGRNPVTGEQVVGEAVSENVCAVMATCGMYDYAGEWLLRVGLPAKSGVSGGLMAVSPGQFGIGMFSPRLDARGNSVRSVEACRLLAEQFSLHLLHRPQLTAPVVFVGDAAMPAADLFGRHKEGDTATSEFVALGLQGEVEFTAAEIVLRAILRLLHRPEPRLSSLIIDLSRVTRVQPVGVAVLSAMVATLQQREVRVVVADPLQRGVLVGADEVSSIDAARESIRLRS
jgi:glutaminase